VDLLPTFQKNGKNSIQIEIDTRAYVPGGRENFSTAAGSGSSGKHYSLYNLVVNPEFIAILIIIIHSQTGVPMSTSLEYPSGENLIQELEKIRLQMMDLKQELAEEKAKFSALIHDRKTAEESLRKSETKIRSIFEAAPIGIGVLTDRVISEVNKQLCVITGYTKDELLHQDTRKLYPTDDDYEYVGRVKYQQISEQGTGTVETRFKRKDGRIINVLLKSTLLDANDISAGVTFTVLDITERKQAEEALRQSKENYEELVQNANSAILRWKKDGTISIFNEYAQTLFGYKAEEIIGKNVSILVPQKDSSGKDLTGLIQDITDHPERYINNVNENICRDGRRILMAWTNKAVCDQHGRVKELLAVGTDITEQKRSEEALRQSEIKFRTVFEQSAIGMGRVCFDDARWIDVNDAFCNMLGYTRAELLSMPWPEITHPDDLDLDLIPFRRMAAGELNTYTIEKRFLHKQGHHVWARLALSLVRDRRGNRIMKLP
jgi:PAS domain S-box-containing protein